MSFARIRLPGAWTNGSTVPSAQFETIDANLAKAVDGSGGGAYSLTGNMTIGSAPGVTWTFTLPVTFNADVTVGTPTTMLTVLAGASEFTNSVAFDNGIVVQGGGSFRGSVDFFDAVTIGGGSTDQLTVKSNTTFNYRTEYNNLATFHGDVTVDDAMTVGGDLAVGGLDVNGAAIFHGIVRAETGEGYIERRTLVLTVGAPATVSPLEYDEVVIKPSFVGGGFSNIVQIDDAGVGNMASMTFVSQSSTVAVAVYSPGGGLLGILIDTPGTTGGSTNLRRMEIRRVSGSWTTFDGAPAY